MRLMLASLAHIVLVLSPCISADSDADCRDWPNQRFFEVARPENVLDCLATGADLEAQDEYGWTPLHLAAGHSEDPAVIEALIGSGADVEARYQSRHDLMLGLNGFTALHLAAATSEHAAVIEALIGGGADVAARDEYGFTPLHRAARYSLAPAVIEVLIGSGADLEARDEYGWTPLHAAAAFSRQPEVIEALLDAGADPTARDIHGLIPWDYAKDRESLKTSNGYWRLNEARF